MDDYCVRIGTTKRRRPAPNYGALLSQPYREAEDDGAVIVHAGDHTPVCRDCRRGHLQWAEAGYVSWHRVCDVCGSHWQLFPITWGPARPSGIRRPAGDGPRHELDCDVFWEDAWSDERGPRACTCGAQPDIDAWQVEQAALLARSGGLVRWADGRGEVPLDADESIWQDEWSDDGGPTWGAFVPLLTPAMWAAAEAQAERMAGMVVVPCAWARRARFYA